ncbi:DUF3326 domain-containing protein [Prochlorococcus sp. MIT 1307]|uniref:DUF3326 domain-containing protein n=1 Tax=Prochlorococcus sp. MIT 1307 TaxID=3096219 RepID=UPI002A74D5DE|nr:DUF3326 domain-containing protein [Prochlorococcus sp. MIT 1307]
MAIELPTLLVIPTGIGCSVGGYAGDAIPSARLLAGASGCLITHPNVMNGAALYWSDPRIKYVEGFGLDGFATGEIVLRSVRQQRIGLLLDAGIETELRLRHLQVAEACKASLGLNIGPVVTTEVPLDISFHEGRSGSSWGFLAQVDALLEAGEKLKKAGSTAIAVVTRFPDDLGSAVLDSYRKGNGVDVLAGAEAVISHLLVKHLYLPCAHAPALSALPLDAGLDPRAAGEELGHTFLPCVLVGLDKAPDLVQVKRANGVEDCQIQGSLHVDQLGALVAPDGALGGAAVLSCLERNVPLIVVSNSNVLRVTAKALGLDKDSLSNNKRVVLHANSYCEAAGFITLLREGINIESVCRPISHIS